MIKNGYTCIWLWWIAIEAESRDSLKWCTKGTKKPVHCCHRTVYPQFNQNQWQTFLIPSDAGGGGAWNSKAY